MRMSEKERFLDSERDKVTIPAVLFLAEAVQLSVAVGEKEHCEDETSLTRKRESWQCNGAHQK